MLTLKDIYDQFTPGTDGFGRAIEKYCGMDLTSAQAMRIGAVARTPDEFVQLWTHFTWWRDEAITTSMESAS